MDAYGVVLTDTKNITEQRGSGKWNPPPFYYSMEAQKQITKMNNQESKYLNLVPQDSIKVRGLEHSHFNTPDDSADLLRKRIYQVGSTGFHSEDTETWEYTEYALKSLAQGGMIPTPFAMYFFSKENVEYIQDRMVQEVFKHTGEKVKHQSIDELINIMVSSMLYAYSGWLPGCSLEERLTRLNKAVLEEVVKQVLQGINQYRAYYKDASTLPIPLSHPTYVSMSGSRTLMNTIGFDSGLERTKAANSFTQRFNIL